MAKGGIQNKGKKELSKHSREARRATSPSINTDKSLKDVKPPAESVNYRPAVLAVHSGAGVTKSKKGRKAVLSSKARRRQAKGLDRAEAIIDRTAKKVQRSKNQARNTESRSKAWDEVNKQIPSTKSSNMFARLEEEQDDDFEDTDEEMNEDEQGQASDIIAPTTISTSTGQANEDEIL